MKKVVVLLIILSSFIHLSIQEKRNDVDPDFLKSNPNWAENQLAKLSLEEKIAQFFMVASWSNRGEEHQQEIEELVLKDKIGGIIFFQGDREDLQSSIKRFQGKAKTPLLIGLDGEWGLGMRIMNQARFPFAYTIGATQDTILAEKIGAMMAQEFRDMGVHINFAPVADVNSNPENPVIGFRAFHSDEKIAAKLVAATVKGIESGGVLSCLKHFPGHGDTDKDSHYELPTISHQKDFFNDLAYIPFKAGIQAGASGVMMAHLSVPSLDDSKTPTSLSKKVIKEELKGKLGFKGLVISDALNMKAVANLYGKVDVVVKAFKAGNDILLFPENVTEAIQAIKNEVIKGNITEQEINDRCLKVLQAKAYVLHQKERKDFTSKQIEQSKLEVYEKANTLLINKKTLPIGQVNDKIAVISIGTNPYALKEESRKYGKFTFYHYFTFEEAIKRFKDTAAYTHVVTSIHANSVLANNNFAMPGNLNAWLDNLPKQIDHIGVLFGNPMMLKNIDLASSFNAFVVAYENHPLAQKAIAQALFGVEKIDGKLSLEVNSNLHMSMGITLDKAGRLKYSCPEALGIDPRDLEEIDELVNKGIKANAFPGCQIFVAIDGNVIYNKNFGTVTYEDSTKITSQHVYDVASISKIVSSTAALMKLEDDNKFNLESKLGDYLPELTENYPNRNIYLKDMMAHQTGFTPWIAFYKQTVNRGVLDKTIYSEQKTDKFNTPVATNLWIRNDYETTIYNTILKTPLGRAKRYEYSDLGYYFVRKIVEKKGKKTLDKFMLDEFWYPMQTSNIRFLPLLHFDKKWIVPTELDTTFRGRLVHGYVHDPGAAMLGGVGGHAGVFANATDLGAMMQLFLNKGLYNNKQYISPEIIEKYTSQQFKTNRRGAGFDRPTNSRKKGPTCGLVSLESYGHSGFTGTYTWADPAYGINYVFLSNRVYPDATNKKIQEMGTRTEIQRVIYEAVLKAKKVK